VLGTVVIGGMLAASILAIFFVPVSFVVIERFGLWIGLSKPQPQGTSEPEAETKGVHA
jgi:HAE1 family hydrophobic/amphiphilic exporter-1